MGDNAVVHPDRRRHVLLLRRRHSGTTHSRLAAAAAAGGFGGGPSTRRQPVGPVGARRDPRRRVRTVRRHRGRQSALPTPGRCRGAGMGPMGAPSRSQRGGVGAGRGLEEAEDSGEGGTPDGAGVGGWVAGPEGGGVDAEAVAKALERHGVPLSAQIIITIL